MRRIISILLPIATTLSLLCGCTDYEDVLRRKGESEYTVILYGTTGGNLDKHLHQKLFELLYSDFSKEVNVAALVKFSKEMQDRRDLRGTRRFILFGNHRVENEYYADASFQMDSPDNFASFISEIKSLMPAKRYILILWNHGEEFSIFDQPLADNTKSRAILYDDNLKYSPMSIFELERGLSLAGTRFEAIILDACRMASAEYLFQIDDFSDYILASSHNIYGGLYYDNFVRSLKKSGDTGYALDRLMERSIERWSRYDTNEAMELSLFDTKHSDNTLSCIAACVEDFIHLRSSLSGDELYRYNRLNGTSQTKSSPFYSEEGILYYINPTVATSSKIAVESVDLAHLFRNFANAFDDIPLKTSLSKLEESLDKMVVKRRSINFPSDVGKPSIAVKWSFSDYFSKDYTREYIERVGQEPLFPALKDIYPHLEFDKRTSWSSLLEGNMLVR